MLHDKIRQRSSGIVLYGLTPPKAQQPPERLQQIASAQAQRLSQLAIDGLVLYDLQDETERTDIERPFPFVQTVDPADYAAHFLQGVALPKIIYRCVGKYEPHTLAAYLRQPASDLAVFVGAASRRQSVALSVQAAYDLRQAVAPEVLLGGVAIPERHQQKHDEHLRVIGKMAQGCTFFVSQCVYNVEAAKNFLSDYYYECQRLQLEMVPIILTMTPCGSLKTLAFMRWLGISVPPWLENDLRYSGDILDQSLAACREIFGQLHEYAAQKKIPIGVNVESVAIRKEEIDASHELVRELRERFT